MNPLEPCQRLLHEGKRTAAREWLLQNPELSEIPRYILLLAVTSEGEELYQWEQAIAKLQKKHPHSDELLHAYQQAAIWSQKGEDGIRYRSHLQAALQLAKERNQPQVELQLLALYSNQQLVDGYQENAQKLLGELITKALRQGQGLLVISQGTILSGLLMGQQQWRAASSLCVSIEASAIHRENWIAYACARMMRATCWQNQNRQEEAIRLLFQTGNELHHRGAIAALNLVKARLAELQLLLGEDIFRRFQQ